MKLTKDFDYDEFFVSSRFPRIAENMKKSAPEFIGTTLFLLCHNILQPVRDFIDAPMAITSGYRDHSLNSRIMGAAKSSLHMRGIAADFTIDGARDKSKRLLLTAYGFIKNHLHDHYGQLILYEDEAGNFINIHVSLPAAGHTQITKRKLRLLNGKLIDKE